MRRVRVVGADAGDSQQFTFAVAHLAALAVIGDGEAVALIANALDEMENRRAAVEDDGLILLPVDIDDLFALGDGGERLQWCMPSSSRAPAAAWSWPRPPSMRIRLGHLELVILDALIAAEDDFAHGGKVVYALDACASLNLR